jgi:hypothetical protein
MHLTIIFGAIVVSVLSVVGIESTLLCAGAFPCSQDIRRLEDAPKETCWGKRARFGS